jgi:CHAT domain-containing protein
MCGLDMRILAKILTIALGGAVVAAQIGGASSHWEKRAEEASGMQRRRQPEEWKRAAAEFDAIWNWVLSEDGKAASGKLRCEAMLGRGRGRVQTGRSAEAIPILEEARVECERAGDQLGVARALSSEGAALIPLDKAERAAQLLVDARERYAGLAQADAAEKDRVSNNLATAYWLLGRLEDAGAEYERILETRRAAKDRYGEMLAQTGIGNVLLYRGEAAEAREAFSAALEIARQIPSDFHVAQALNSLGFAQFTVGRFRDATARYEEALPLWRKTKNREGECMTLTNIAWQQLAERKYTAALASYQKAAEAARDLPAGRSLSYIRHGVGIAKMELGEAAAREEFEASLVWKREHKDVFGEAATLERIAELERRERKLDAARRHAEEALRQREEILDRAGEAKALVTLARIEADAGNGTAALGRVERAVAIVERLRAAIGTAETKAAYFATVQETYRLWMDLTPAGKEFAVKRFEIEERRRARALLDSVGTANPERAGAGRRATERKLEAASRRLQELGGKPGFAAARKEMQRLLSELDVATSNERDEFVGAPPLSAVKLRASLRADEAVLEYSLGAKRGWAWLVRRERLEEFALPDAAAIRRAAARSMSSVAKWEKRDAGAEKEFEAAALEVAALCVRPIAGLAQVKRLVIVGEEALAEAPWAAMLRDKEMSLAPSASVFVALREKSVSGSFASGRGFALADPDFGMASERYPSLPYAREELRLLRKAARGNLDELSGADASVAKLNARKLGEYRWLHFATHAEADPEDAAMSGIVLAGAGKVRAHEIARWRLNGALAVLNACRTAQGVALPGEGTMSLARAFLAAGAKQVAASLWQIPDGAAARFSKVFYEGLLGEGLTPAAAIERARKQMRAEARYSAPVYWAGFVLVGAGW